jgi:hypothetical protein
MKSYQFTPNALVFCLITTCQIIGYPPFCCYATKQASKQLGTIANKNAHHKSLFENALQFRKKVANNCFFYLETLFI